MLCKSIYDLVGFIKFYGWDICERGHEIWIWGFRGVLSLLRVVKMIRGRVRDVLGLGKWMASGLQLMRVGEGGDIC